MKKRLVLLAFVLIPYSNVFAIGGFLPDNDIYTKTQEEVLDTSDIQGNPLRQGAGDFVDGAGGSEGLEGDFIRPEDTEADFDSTLENTLRLIRTGINYVLGLAAFVALVYFIINGLIAMFSKDDEAQKKAGNSLRTAAIAIAGIALSWFIVSAIFWLVDLFTA